MDSTDIVLETKLLSARGLQNLMLLTDSQTRKHGDAPKNRYYRTWVEGRVDGKQVALFINPVLPDMGFGLLSLHLSQFPDLESVYLLFRKIFEHQWMEVLSGRLRRSDLCIDLLLPPTAVFDSITVPRARVVHIYRNKDMAAHFGRGDRFLRVYAKEQRVADFDYIPDGLKDLPPNEVVVGTRIETQLRRKKLPITELSQIERLRSFKPFQNVKLIGTEPIPACFPEGVISDRVGHFMLRRSQVGASQARREFNRSGHFERDVGSKLQPTHHIDLQSLFQKRLEKFLSRGLPLPTEVEKGTSDSSLFFENSTESFSEETEVGHELH